MDAASGPTLVDVFYRETWVDGVVEAWVGRVPPWETPVSSVCCALMRPDEEILLVDVLKRGWDLPGGHMEPGETPREALVREMLEETGLTEEAYSEPVLVGWLLIRPAQGSSRCMLVYSAVYRGSIDVFETKVPGEIGDIRFWSKREVPPEVALRVWWPFVKHIKH